MKSERLSEGRSATDYTVIVAYDGERTEDDYFRGWKLIIPPSRLSLIPIFVKSGGNPLHAVKAAAKKKRAIRHYAEFWCVTDVDDARPEDVAEATLLAISEGIKLCISARCFEVWFSLHWEKSTRPITCEADAIACVCKYHGSYRLGSKTVPFSVLFPRTEEAIDNAGWLENQRLGNPTTAVHALARKLLQNLK